MSKLNAFHSNLKFTHEFSPQTINFLDLTIYKGYNFPFTNILDIKKPLNLYQYLHYTSNHPSKVFKAIIKGECVRFIRTNTTQESYESTVHVFKQRLRKRGYPRALIEKTSCIAKYSNRHQYLKQENKFTPSSSPPIFKALPPPQFSTLKKLVLQDYPKIRFISPRFVALKHPTIRNILVRAKVNATDEQFLDISLLLGDTAPTPHTEIASLPKLRHETTAISSCRQCNCSTCKNHLLTTSTFRGTRKNRNTFRIRHKLSRQSQNIIYLITCLKCKKQYVGQTSNQLNTRINQHRSNIFNKKSTYIAKHFNLPDHSILDLKVQPTDKATSSNPGRDLYRLETFWIKTLGTLTPHGLNVSPGLTNVHV